MLVPTICFQGNCDEAITFYKGAVGAEVKTVNYLRDAPQDFVMEGFTKPNHVLNSDVLIYGTQIAMLDGAKTQITGECFTLTLFVDSAEEATSVFNRLADGGKVIEALAPQFWATLCGDVQDRFGVTWHIATKE